MSSFVYPWPYPTKHWPAINIYWDYEATLVFNELVQDKVYAYSMHAKVDSTNDRIRQDIYNDIYSDPNEYIATMVTDYKYSLSYEIAPKEHFDERDLEEKLNDL